MRRVYGLALMSFSSAMALNPARYNDYIYFKVIAVSAAECVGM